ncbi:MAG: Hsp20 family protein [Verrucomicrobia bacterium]|nr:Hsp20 family protein [Verrucomicrobiota bacterium]
MKTHITDNIVRSMALGAVILSAGVLTSLSGVLGADSDHGGFVGKMKQWQERMSETFRDAIGALRGKTESGKSAASASMDLREQSDTYTLRLSLPDRDLDKVEVTLDGKTLRIMAPEQGAAGRYEQSIVLADVSKSTSLQIDRRQKDGMIVVTVPKELPSDEPVKSPPFSDPLLEPLSDLDRSVMERMERMQREMNRIFKESFDEFKLMPEHRSFFDEQRFGSSVDLKEEGDNYVIRAYLPGRNMDNVNVTVDGQTLKIEAKEEESTGGKKNEKQRMERRSHFMQIITLPGRVNAVKMKTDRKDGVLIVTLPKA